MENETVIISIGGSVIVPDAVDTDFLKDFRKLILELAQDKKIVLISGGGKICRKYNEAAIAITPVAKEDLDWLGIQATRLNAYLLKCILSDIACSAIVESPEGEIAFDNKVLVGGGWKPGWSTDYCAVRLAQRFGSSTVINMTNTDYVYDEDPRKNPDAKKIESLSWQEMKKLVGDEWSPGLNMPFDPLASAEAEKSGFRVVILGNDLENLKKCSEGQEFKGNIIS